MTLVTGHLEDNQGGGGHRDYTRLDVVKIPLVEDSVAKISESDRQGAGEGRILSKEVKDKTFSFLMMLFSWR